MEGRHLHDAIELPELARILGVDPETLHAWIAGDWYRKHTTADGQRFEYVPAWLLVPTSQEPR